MEANTPEVSGDVPSGATMRPRYMVRVMNTYPVSEAEMEHVSTLHAQAITCFSLSSLLFGLAGGVFTNGLFATDFTPISVLAMSFVAPLVLLFSVVFFACGFAIQRRRRSAWDRIKSEANPVQTIAPAAEMVAPASV